MASAFDFSRLKAMQVKAGVRAPEGLSGEQIATGVGLAGAAIGTVASGLSGGAGGAASFAGGALSGAGAGAKIGTLIAPGIGTAIGAGAGALIGGVGGLLGFQGEQEAAEVAEAELQFQRELSKKKLLLKMIEANMQKRRDFFNQKTALFNQKIARSQDLRNQSIAVIKASQGARSRSDTEAEIARVRRLRGQ